MDLLIRLFTLFIYITLLYELVGIPVPSIASTYQLVFTKDDFQDEDGLLGKIRQWPLVVKGVCLILPSALVVFIYILPLMQAVWPGVVQFLYPLPLPGGLSLTILGMLLALFGRFLGLSAAWMMYHEKAVPDQEGYFELKTKGIFGFTRNPILIGMYIAFIGLWLLYPTWEMGLGFFFLVANMHFRVILEEEYLSWYFGQPYRDFMTKTRRYI